MPALSNRRRSIQPSRFRSFGVHNGTGGGGDLWSEKEEIE